MAEIIKNHNKLKEVIEKHKREGKKIIFGNGCFDILHVGHIRYIKSAKALGDILVIAINSDKSLEKIKKRKPIISEDERLEILSAIKYIDYLTLFDEERVDKLILLLKPHIHAKGTDYTMENVPERNTVLSYGGKIAIVGDLKTHSSSDLIKKIKQLT